MTDKIEIFDEFPEDPIKNSIAKVARATMYFIQGKITREEREKLYDDHYDFIASTLSQYKQQLVEQIRSQQESYPYYQNNEEIFDDVISIIKGEV